MTRVLDLKTSDRIVPDGRIVPFCDLTVTSVWADPSLEAPEDVYVDVSLHTWSHQWDVDQLPAAAGAQDCGYVGLNPPQYRLRYGPGDEVPIRFHHPDVGHRPGYVAGHCGHAVAESEWRAGYRVCERCPADGAA